MRSAFFAAGFPPSRFLTQNGIKKGERLQNARKMEIKGKNHAFDENLCKLRRRRKKASKFVKFAHDIHMTACDRLVTAYRKSEAFDVENVN